MARMSRLVFLPIPTRGLAIFTLIWVWSSSITVLRTGWRSVRKMPLSGLDPSMLIGFLCRDEADWWDFRKRVGEVCCAPLLVTRIDFPLLASANNIFCTGRTSYMAYRFG